MRETVTVKNGTIVYTNSDGTETAATGMVTRTSTRYLFKAGKGKASLTPCDIFKLDGSIEIAGHVKGDRKIEDGARIIQSVFRLNFPGFSLDAYDLERVEVLSPPVSPARLSIVPRRPDDKKPSGMLPDGWSRS